MLLKNYLGDTKIKVLQNHACNYFGLSNDFLLLSISRFLLQEPQKFFDRDACDYFLSWLNATNSNNKPILQDALTFNWNNLALGFESLESINITSKKDSNMWSLSDWDRAVLISQVYLNRYSTLVDSVYNHFIYPIAHGERTKRSVSTEGLKLYGRVQELEMLDAKPLLTSINRIIRNGIAHGHVTFDADEITFTDTDKNISVTESYTSFITRCDGLLDLVNGIALAYYLFLNENQNNFSLNDIPLRLLVPELKQLVNNRNWNVEACLPGTFGQNEEQLQIFARYKESDFESVQYNCSLTASELFKLGASQKRFFFYLKSRKNKTGWCSIQTEHLKSLLNDSKPSDKPIDSALFEFRKHYPKWLRRFNTYRELFIEYIKTRKFATTLQNQKIWFYVEDVHRNKWRKRVSINVVIRADVSKNEFRNLISLILFFAKRNANKHLGFFRVLRWMPTTAIEISVFDRQYRATMMKYPGLGSEKLATIKQAFEPKLLIIDPLDSSIEIIKGIRIAWNNNSKFAE